MVFAQVLHLLATNTVSTPLPLAMYTAYVFFLYNGSGMVVNMHSNLICTFLTQKSPTAEILSCVVFSLQLHIVSINLGT